MKELIREKEHGLDFEYLGDVLDRKVEIGSRFQTPGFGLAAQLFATVAKHVIKHLGVQNGEKLLKEAVEEFGFERGKRIAEKVRKEGLELSFKNWLIYSDIDSMKNFRPITTTPDGDFLAKIKHCTFFNAAEDWGLGDYAKYYCKYLDYKILEGYNPEIKLILKDRYSTGDKRCFFRYIIKDDNK